MDRKKNKNSNAGMTLLEVIIAVSIFSITAIVLLQSFVTSSRINKKSNLYLEATTVAQNIMEEIKAKKFAEVSLAFNYPLDSSGSSRLTFLDPQKSRINSGAADELGVGEVLAAKDNSDSVVYNPVRKYTDGVDETNVTASVISTDNGKTYKFNPRKTGDNASKYYFELTNVNNNHETFDALVTFDGSKDSGYKKKTSTNSEEGKNDYLAPNISNLDTDSNAPFIVEKQKYLDAFSGNDGLIAKQFKFAHDKWESELNAACGTDTDAEDYEQKKEAFIAQHKEPLASDLNAEEVFNNAQKTLLITIDYDKETEKVEVNAKYTIDAHGYVSSVNPEYGRMDLCPCGGDPDQENSDPTQKYFCSIVSNQNIYTSSADKVLKNIYIFYYPNYKSQSNVKPLDKIIVENLNNYPVNLYIAKQQDENNKNSILTDENKYRMSLVIKENPETSNWNTSPSLYKSQIKLRTNLDYNISDIYDKLDRPKINQMSLTYQDNSTPVRHVSGIAAKKIVDYNGLDDKKLEDRIYTTKVEVYKAGAAEKGFPKEDLVVTLDGTKED